MNRMGATTKRVLRGKRVVKCPYDGSDIVVECAISSYVDTQCARGNLEEHHRQAANRFSAILERCMSQGLTVAPFAVERVQTSGFQTALPDHVVEAQKQLALLAQYLGRRQYNLLHSVIMDGLTATALSSATMGERSPYNRHEVSKAIREALDETAQFFGLATKAGEVRRWAKTVSVASEYPREIHERSDDDG